MGGTYQWPRLSEVMQYRKSVRQLVTDLISSAPFSLPITMDCPWVSDTSARSCAMYVLCMSIM